jgi:hypothetical protein
VRTFLTEVPDIHEIGVPEFLSLLPPPTRETAADYYSFLVSWRQAAGLRWSPTSRRSRAY